MADGSHAFRVLGDLSVTTDGERRPITAAKQRAALAILLLCANRTVTSETLIEGIWGGDLPQHPDSTLQIVVSRLRCALGSAAPRLVSDQSGYRMEVGPGELDLSLVSSAFTEGRRLRAENDPSRAADVLAGALARWTADPLHDLYAFPFCPTACSRLRELRVSICELRNDTLLEAGRHVELLETIEEWIDAEPWRERLRVQHVLALYRSGRQVDALRAYDAYRQRLVDELGVEPSDELRELHRDVLAHAPKLALGVEGFGSRVPLWTSLVLPFVGRRHEEETIFGHIRDVFAGGRSMVLIEGEAGIGKTRLALEVARRVQDDAIVLSVTANDSMRPALVGLAEAVVVATRQLPDGELHRCLGRPPGELVAAAADEEARALCAVASCLTALSRRAPIVLLVDDLHRSGVPLLLLLGRVMVVDEQQRILVLATARTASPERWSNLADLTGQLERYGRLDRMRLDGLALKSVERLLWRLGTPEPAEKAQLLHDVTNGHPFFLSEILQTDDWQRALVDPPANVREFVRRRVHELGDAEEGILVDATGLLIAFDVPLLAEITGVPRATTAALIDRAVAAGVVRTVDKGTFTFVHELCRRALIDHIDEVQRERLQYRIATALETRDLPPEVLALHWRLVPGPEAEERARHYGRAAAAAAYARD